MHASCSRVRRKVRATGNCAAQHLVRRPLNAFRVKPVQGVPLCVVVKAEAAMLITYALGNATSTTLPLWYQLPLNVATVLSFPCVHAQQDGGHIHRTEPVGHICCPEQLSHLLEATDWVSVLLDWVVGPGTALLTPSIQPAHGRQGTKLLQWQPVCSLQSAR